MNIRRGGSVAVALVCLGIAAYLAFDWADYGSDSTCGSLVRYKGAGGTCAHLMHGRLFGVVVLGVIALVFLGTAAITRGRSGDEVLRFGVGDDDRRG
jgi:hypothetical protein